VWKLKIRLNIKYFLWIALSNTILTWENFQKRTWQDTGIFFPCKNNLEDVSHMLISCQFNQIVWVAALSFGHVFKKLDGMIWNEMSSTHTCSSVLGSVKCRKWGYFLGGIPIPFSSLLYGRNTPIMKWKYIWKLWNKKSVETQHWQVRLSIFFMVILKAIQDHGGSCLLYFKEDH